MICVTHTFRVNYLAVSRKSTIFAANNRVTIMEATLRPTQLAQLHSFWNLIQTTDEGVQRELFILLQRKYAKHHNEPAPKQSSFLSMQGILKGDGNVDTDRRMLDEYIQEKYGV